MTILIPVNLFLRVKEKNYAHFAHEDKSLGRDPLFVYVRLFSLAVDTGSVSLPKRELADDVRISVRTLQNALRTLVNLGYVRVDAVPGQPSTYSLLLSAHVLRLLRKYDLIDNPAWYGRPGDETPERVAASGESGAERTPPHGVRTSPARPAHLSYNVEKNNKNKDTPLPPSLPQTRPMPPRGESGKEGGFSSDFSRLWDAYPVKKGKSSARRAYGELARDGDAPPLDRLLEVISAFKSDDDQWRRGYAPYLATWLRERRWDDEILRRGRNSENVAGTTTPVPRATVVTLPPPPVPARPPLSPEAEKHLQEIRAVLCALWPEPTNPMAIDAHLRLRAVSGTLPSAASLLAAARDYLSATPRPAGLWRWLKNNEPGKNHEITPQSGDCRIPGPQVGNRRAA